MFRVEYTLESWGNGPPVTTLTKTRWQHEADALAFCESVMNLAHGLSAIILDTRYDAELDGEYAVVAYMDRNGYERIA